MTRLVRVRTLTVGTPIEFRLGDPSWLTPYRGRLREVLVRPGVDDVIRLDPLTADELAQLGGGNYRVQVHLGSNAVVAVLDLPGATDVPAVLPVAVPRPRVPVRRLDDDRHRAECAHCDWTLESGSTVRAEITDDVAYHREQHRRGALAVTR